MARYKIKIQYDGSAFFGWQLQSKDRTVQGEIEKALLSFSNESRIIVNGAGRTDTGVHATGQVAHFDLETRLDESSLKNAINGHLPKDCRIMTLEIVDDSFHARFTAIKRHYRYQCMSEQKLAYRNQC
ncbi:MAG: tRNA pseudouridine synthase A [Candidatus Marinimicrobia bacterium]|nr:tRNA pseudouridine synthase A [Candidatus Neomarinimicrobiota bacterium]